MFNIGPLIFVSPPMKLANDVEGPLLFTRPVKTGNEDECILSFCSGSTCIVGDVVVDVDVGSVNDDEVADLEVVLKADGLLIGGLSALVAGEEGDTTPDMLDIDF